MSSPVEISFTSLICIDKSSSTPIYIQLAQQFVNAIQRGYLSIGARMPGTRILSKDLKVHRKTIIAAFEELQAQGWLEIVPNKGTFILQKDIKQLQSRHVTSLQTIKTYPEKTGFEFTQSNILDSPFELNPCSNYFTDGTPDIRITQLQALSQHYGSALKRKSNLRKMANYQEHGSLYFKEQLSNYLNLTRGLHIAAYNLLVSRSSEMSLYLIARVVLSPGDCVVVGNLSNFSINMTFAQVGAKIATVAMDEEGICVHSLTNLVQQKKVRMLYLTPHHHYPTTVTLSAQRRIEILKLAKEYGFFILEDDYDYDFHYENTAILPLASADSHGLVIYTGTFGKSLIPTFRTSFVVAPKNLIQEMNKYLGIIDRHGDIVTEYALGQMIEEGDIHRHLKKSILAYKNRRDETAITLKKLFNDTIQFTIPKGGLAFWVRFKENIQFLKVAKYAQEQDLFIPRNIFYQNQEITAMRLGFGNWEPLEMKNNLEILKESMLKI